MTLIASPQPSPEFRFKRLLLEARRGSSDARWMVVQLFRNMMLSVANDRVDRTIPTREAPSDIVQETIVEAQRDLDQFDGMTEPEMKAWLKQILIHNIKNINKKYFTQMRDVKREQSIDLRDDEATYLADSDPSPSSIVIRRERHRALDLAIRSLPDHDRTVIELRYRKDLSFAQIATLIDETEETTRKRWSRALQKLSRLLAKDE